MKFGLNCLPFNSSVRVVYIRIALCIVISEKLAGRWLLRQVQLLICIMHESCSQSAHYAINSAH